MVTPLVWVVKEARVAQEHSAGFIKAGSGRADPYLASQQPQLHVLAAEVVLPSYRQLKYAEGCATKGGIP
jgi:hypothetical protein